MDTDKSHFDWLRIEINAIQSQRFHIFEPLTSTDYAYKTEKMVVLPMGEYLEFLQQFGYARMFTDHQDSPVVSIYSLKNFRRHLCKNGSVFVGFGYRSYQSAYFDEALILKGIQSPVYTVNASQGKVIASNFSEWLIDAYQWAKSKYSTKRWASISAGPQPFTIEEQKIADAVQEFHFNLLGFHEDGDALIEVKNDSTLTLPYLSVGVKDKSDAVLIGGAWLNTSKIEPNQKAIIKHNCYKDRIKQDEVMLFRRYKPIPEKREAYWEFKSLSK
jgi:hypothetical protein